MKGLNDGIRLANGAEIPCIGYGTYKLNEGKQTEECVLKALEAGYRHIDSASFYKNERSVGNAVKSSGIKRSDIFVTSKIWNSDQGYESALRAFDRTISELGFDYLDMYMIHWPVPSGRKADHARLNYETWRAFEKLYKEGRIRVPGVCNFLEHHLKPLLEKAEIKPMVNQLELHPRNRQAEAVNFCRENGIRPEAWAPLMRGKIFEIPLFNELAKKYKKSEAQIAVRWSLQSGFIPLPKSGDPKRIYENADVFNFDISDADMARLNALESKPLRVGMHPDSM